MALNRPDTHSFKKMFFFLLFSNCYKDLKGDVCESKSHKCRLQGVNDVEYTGEKHMNRFSDD